jgi:3-hydroxyisobutyrate dehydrogenase/2-hydroxy-3-oxopropionate reductase
MGYPMARNLLRAGHEVALWSHTASKARQLASEEKGGAFCATPKEVGAAADYIFSIVGDTEMAREVILGTDGVAAGAKPGTVVVDASTISPDTSREIGQELAAKGIQYLDAPCTGSTPGANAGTLTFMIGGDQKVYEQAKPYLEIMGKRFYYCGGPGMGLHAKLSQNLVLSNIIQAFNEAIVLSTKAGVDPQLMLDILANSAAKCGLIEFKAPYVLKRDFTPQFSLKWMHKDVGLILETGKELNVPLPLTSLTRQLFQASVSSGQGEEDFCSSIKLLENFAGIQVKQP